MAATPPALAPAPVAAPAPVVATAEHDDGIAWRRGDVDAAFAEAKAANKPVFLYWGAGWCPPCNQVKATLFKTREFIERTQHFVPVYVDGDTPAAQQLGTRFSVSGYPTMVLFRPDGTEVTRLPGEVEPERYLQVLTLGMNGAKPVKATLKSALADGKGLGADDWRMLAWYSWDTDDQQLVPTAQVTSTLKTLAAHCPANYADVRTRLLLKTAASTGDAKGKPDAASTIDRKPALAATEAVLASPTAAREHFDVLTNSMPEIVRAITAAKSAERARLVASADHALAALASDTTLSNTDRLGATVARVQLATIDDADNAPVHLPDALRDTVKSEVARVDRESTDGYERQTVINSAAYLLTSAGMIDESDALLKAELARSHSPYYFMLDLASNAKKRGDKAAAVDWASKAYDAAKGPATRLQWGASYVGTLVDLAPDDAARIERATTQILGEVEPAASSFEGRNRKSLTRIATKVAAWNAKGAHAAEAARIDKQARNLCERLPAGAPERTQMRRAVEARSGESRLSRALRRCTSHIAPTRRCGGSRTRRVARVRCRSRRSSRPLSMSSCVIVVRSQRTKNASSARVPSSALLCHRLSRKFSTVRRTSAHSASPSGSNTVHCRPCSIDPSM